MRRELALTGAVADLGVLGLLSSSDYLISALAELEKHAKKTLRQARSYRRKAGRAWCEDSKWYILRAREFEEQGRNDLAEIQRILANPGLNR